MGIEIERKFLVKSDDWRGNHKKILFTQGYLSSEPDRVVRVRTEGDSAWITIKGRTTGATRGEWNYQIPMEDAKDLLRICKQPLIEKYRHYIFYEGLTWEVDEFLGKNEGLIVAEVELSDESQKIIKPDWIGKEVTEDWRYSNASLAENPFSSWSFESE